MYACSPGSPDHLSNSWVVLSPKKISSPKKTDSTLPFSPVVIFENIAEINSPSSRQKKIFHTPLFHTPLLDSLDEPKKPLADYFLDPDYLSCPQIANLHSVYQKKVCGGIHRPWGEGLISKQASFERMNKNLKKAWKEHFGAQEMPQVSAYPNQSQENGCTFSKREDEKESPDFSTLKNHSFNDHNFRITAGYAENQGPRTSMEDAHFYLTLPTGTLVGVLDGHGGREVADFGCKRIQELFPSFLEASQGNVHQAFEAMFYKIQDEVILVPKWNTMGCTVVVSYIENKTKIIYTATSGDSETKLYRPIDDQLHSIPLSCVRSWASPRDEWRAAAATGQDYLVPVTYYWNLRTKKVDAHLRRIDKKCEFLLKNDSAGINVSRGFGDHQYNLSRPIDVFISKPKITSLLLKPGDLVVLACDGLFGCPKKLPERKIVKCIEHSMHESPAEISQNLVNLALEKKSRDNITVVTLKIERPQKVTPSSLG